MLMLWKPFSGGDARGRCVHGSGWSPGQEREPRGQCGGARHRTCGEGGQSHRPRFRGQPPTQGRSVPQTIPHRICSIITISLHCYYYCASYDLKKITHV